MDDIQQQIDRTKLILNNSDSGDLLLLTYMASRLHLLRELTSRDYDDFFTARAQYSSWCQEQQHLYLQLAQESLQNQEKLSQISKLIRNLCFEQTKDFLLQVTDHTCRSSNINTMVEENMSLGDDEMKRMVIQFKITPKLSFDSLTEGGEKIVRQYSNSYGPLPSSSSALPISFSSQTSLPSTPRQPTQSSEIKEERARAKTLFSTQGTPQEQRERVEERVPRSAQSSPRLAVVSSPRLTAVPSPGLAHSSPGLAQSSPHLTLPLLSLDEFERDLTVSLSEYEQNVCSTMERLSQMSLEAIRKKFIDIRATEGEDNSLSPSPSLTELTSRRRSALCRRDTNKNHSEGLSCFHKCRVF
jgi:hypothetical protein